MKTSAEEKMSVNPGRAILNELKALDKSLNESYYEMGRLLYGLRYLHESLGYSSMKHLIDAELTCSYATASRYMNTFKHFKRLKYSKKEAVDLITDLSFTNVAPQLAHMKQKKDKPELKKMIDDEGNCHMTFWMTTAERDEVKELLRTFDPRNAHHPSFSLLKLVAAYNELMEEVCRLHNPHSGEECDCKICREVRDETSIRAIEMAATTRTF